MDSYLNENHPGYRLVQRYACMMGLDFDLAIEQLLIRFPDNNTLSYRNNE